ncbi:hypothetical protein ABEB36_001906 [Hypothenemus hampei]|uniref:protein acetyllysine N-acetyltransferase n=1 Tax=Hypothenemus hampei TaxID=57062 RepID=A0ABD1FI11_HYPHA
MDSDLDVHAYESSAKRRKIAIDESNSGETCTVEEFFGLSTTLSGSIHQTEGIQSSTDCDSGYEASTMQSLPTPSHSHHTSPQPDSVDCVSNQSSAFFPNPDQDEEDVEEEEDEDDNASTVSHLSELSGLSNLSGQDWKPMAGSMIWIQEQMQKGINPRAILTDLGVDLEQVPQYIDDFTLWKIIINMLTEPPRRHKLRHVNTLDDVVRLLKGAQKIIVLTGAGVSVSCGIPDFRSRDGIYSRLAIEFPNLPNPQAMFDISYFTQDPRPFFKFAKDIYPGKFKPSPCHRFIKLLEKHGKLLRNYTQNIDTLEKEAGIERVIECHGSFATATCTKCEQKVSADKIRDIVLAQKIPMCETCHEGGNISLSTNDERDNSSDFKDLVVSGIMKPDIVFFGEGLPDTFHQAMAADKTECDLLLVIGSSLKVRPVALIPSSLPSNIPQILINREPLSHCHFDVELLGDCDVIVNHLCQLLGQNWEEGVYSAQRLQEASGLLSHHDNDKWAEFQCTCTLSSSSSSTCNCQASDLSKLKERHVSIDSAKDSGIGENSNFADLDQDSVKEEVGCNVATPVTTFSSLRIAADAASSVKTSKNHVDDDGMEDDENMRGYWQPKVKKSLAHRLPPNSFHLVPPSRYIFPGAEVYYDPDDKSSFVSVAGEDDEDEEEGCSSSDTMSECC